MAKKNSINPNAAEKFAQKRKKNLIMDSYLKGILNSDRVILSQAITLIESTKPEHQAIAQEIIEACMPYSNNSIRIGITGSPGVGKSTFIEAFGKMLTKEEKKVAVLAIDPSSQISGGSILGDKTRMEELGHEKNVFIRPSPAGTSLGGVARKTRETIILCEAAGFDTIIIETVGVGQSEIAVHSMVDFFVLLLLPGAGDELQGIKRGIVEMADLIAINKADGDRKILAKQAKLAYKNALHLMPSNENKWNTPLVLTSSLEKTGLDLIWENLCSFENLTKENGFFDKKRKKQALFWLEESIDTKLRNIFANNKKIKKHLVEIKQAVLNGQISSFHAADKLMQLFLGKKK